jgi:dienelactone hydrolase
VAVQAVKEGYIAIAPTTRAFGDTRDDDDKREDKPFSCRIQLMHDLLLGRTPIGDRVWDMQRILDWAIVNFEVDTSRVAITGNSAGGTVTLFAAAIDTRFTIAAPASYFSTFEGSIGSIVHCDCNYIPGIMNWGRMSDVAGLVAPRPISVIHGRKDDIYPITETRKAFEELRKIYESAGAGSHLQLFEGAEGHRYYQAGAWPFIRHYFLSTGK